MHHAVAQKRISNTPTSIFSHLIHRSTCFVTGRRRRLVAMHLRILGCISEPSKGVRCYHRPAESPRGGESGSSTPGFVIYRNFGRAVVDVNCGISGFVFFGSSLLGAERRKNESNRLSVGEGRQGAKNHTVNILSGAERSRRT